MSTPQGYGQSMSAAFIEQIRQKIQPNLDGIYQRKTPVTTTTLPTTARDGDIYRYKALATATGAALDVWWTLVYDGASGYWYSAGAAPMCAVVDTSQTTASAVYTNLATTGPVITLPFAGEYTYTYGAEMANNTGGAASFMSIDFGGGAADVDAVAIQDGVASTSRTRHNVVDISAATAITAKYRVSGGTGTFLNRFLYIQPLRVR